MSKNKIPQAKIIIILETYPGNGIVLRQEKCIFDNYQKSFGKEHIEIQHPEEINVANLWQDIQNNALVVGAILKQFQKEAHCKSIERAKRKLRANNV